MRIPLATLIAAAVLAAATPAAAEVEIRDPERDEDYAIKVGATAEVHPFHHWVWFLNSACHDPSADFVAFEMSRNSTHLLMRPEMFDRLGRLSCLGDDIGEQKRWSLHIRVDGSGFWAWFMYDSDAKGWRECIEWTLPGVNGVRCAAIVAPLTEGDAYVFAFPLKGNLTGRDGLIYAYDISETELGGYAATYVYTNADGDSILASDVTSKHWLTEWLDGSSI